MSAEDLERYEADMELQLYQEYRDVLGMFQYVIETERRFYLANKFDLQMRNQDGDTYFDITLHDAWYVSDWHFLVDDKGRVIIPPPFREFVEDGIPHVPMRREPT